MKTGIKNPLGTQTLYSVSSRRDRFLRSVAVEEYGEYDEQSAQGELDGELEIKYVYRSDTGNNDGQRRGKTFQNVIGVLDNHRNYKPSARLKNDQIINKLIVSEKEPLLLNDMSVICKTRYQTERYRTERQLNVTHPDGDVAPFQHFFEIDPGEARKTASRECGHESDESVLFGAGRSGGNVAGLSELDQHHSYY